MELKKNPDANIETQKKSYLLIGLVLSLGIVFVLMSWRTYDGVYYDLGSLDDDFIDEVVTPITQREKPPPPPPPKQIIITLVDDDTEIEEEIELADLEADEDMEVEFAEEVIVESRIFTLVEQMPEFKNGEAALYAYLGKNLVYPEEARENQISGIVYVGFVVNKKGKIKDIKLLRGIGGGCDEEALKAVKGMPDWNPGKQRGKVVSVQYELPINFSLR